MKKGLILKMVLSTIMIISIMSIMIIGEYSNVFAANASSSNTGSFDGEHVFIDGTCTDCGATGGECGEKLTWVISADNKILTISGEGDMTDWNRNSTPWKNYKNKITEVIIKEGVTSIGNFAFYEFTALTNVSISETVTSIGNSAFRSLSKLQNITLPKNLVTIEDYAFSGNSSILSSITIPASVTTIGEEVFNSNKKLNTVLFEENSQLTSIGKAAFAYCEALTSMDIPDGVTTIAVTLFQSCTGLVTVTLPEKLEIISSSAFYQCKSLTSIDIPDSVTTIGNSAFIHCDGLTSIEIPNGVTSIGNWAFQYCELTSVTLPSSLTTIGEEAFDSCENLTTVKYLGTSDPNNGATSNVFTDCSKLSEIVLLMDI